MKFTEDKLEQAVIELFESEGYKHLTGDHIHQEMPDVLLRDDLKQYLLNRYSSEDIVGILPSRKTRYSRKFLNRRRILRSIGMDKSRQEETASAVLAPAVGAESNKNG